MADCSQKLWFVDGKANDLTEFLLNHPGGALFLVWHGRDSSVSFRTFRKNPKQNMKVLQNYHVKGANAQPKSLHVPESARFLLPADFDARKDILSYDFDPDNEKLLLNECRRRVLNTTQRCRARSKSSIILSTKPLPPLEGCTCACSRPGLSLTPYPGM